jgi:hydrogenase maturation protease
LKDELGRILLYGFGNPGRQDDALGPLLVQKIERAGLSFVQTDSNYQLNIEDAVHIANFDLVIFVDTTVEEVDVFRVRKITPSAQITFTSHQVKPESVLAMCEDMYGRFPETWLVGIRGYEFDYQEGVTQKAVENCNRVYDFILFLLRLYGEKTMATKSSEKTILIIDDDADIRASMRIVLEAAGFSIGEASDGEEGLKIAEKVNPDAIIIDLMMETIDAGSKVSTQLKESGFDGPIYLLSAAGDAVRYNIDSQELGLAGIFQKPINHEVLITTLKTKLKLQ